MRILRKTAWIMLGIAGSGKSTWIKKNLGDDVKIISKDGIREELGIITGNKKAIGNKEQEEEVGRIQDQRIKDAVSQKIPFVLDNTNLGNHLSEIVRELKRKGYRVVGVKINTPLETCIKRRPEIPVSELTRMSEGMKNLDLTIFDNVIEV